MKPPGTFWIISIPSKNSDMPLEEYTKKRTLNSTPEPAGGKTGNSKLEFVVQKHAASHLHYDFRLEVKGVLKSWAVPKGPSMDPKVKHLAMLVEDHPYDYKDFEGIIPKGNYGAGTVIVWDQGTYEPAEKAKTKKEQEHIMMRDFFSGKMKFILHGKKLKGVFSLVKVNDRGENGWLLTKMKDQYATTKDVSRLEKSVISKKTLEKMAGSPNAEWKSKRSDSNPKKKEESKKVRLNISELVKKGKKSNIPISISPMLCTLTKEVLQDPEYLYELKWDGYRIISYMNNGKVRMDSRSALDYTRKYPNVGKALAQLNHDVVLDGEVVVFNQDGLPDFDALQLYDGHDAPISYCVFDILWLDGYDLTDLPLTDRKIILKSLLEGNEILKYSESFDDGKALYDKVIEMNMEGIVAKKRDSNYVPGQRADNWLKTPTRKRQEFVIGGWSESDKSRSFKSLLFGAYTNGKFEWIGRSGGGYKEKEMPGILKQLQSLEIPTSPFNNKVLDTKGAKTHYVKPKLVANFEFATWTKTGRIRKPATFLGFRKDKKPTDVVREVPKGVDVIEKEIHEEKKSKSKVSTGSNWTKIDKQKVDAAQDFEIGGCTIKINDVDREIWKGITKADLITYYHEVSKYILPYLTDRPQSLHVKPVNANVEGFYIKDMEGRQPDCGAIFEDQRRHEAKGKRNKIDYLVCNNEATLLWMINLGCVDINPWNSRISGPDKPDFIAIDLDPTTVNDSKVDLKKLLNTALAAKEYFDSKKIKAFAKTSGKTGMHFFVPCSGFMNKEVRSFAEYICSGIHDLVPAASTIANSISSRAGKVYVDPSQNDYADTLAAVYSVRPYHIPTVSTPLEWKEINNRLVPSSFTIDNTLKRILKKGDLFYGVLDQRNRNHNNSILNKL
jgi:bifunctional non-homologous end joining protein LigD